MDRAGDLWAAGRRGLLYFDGDHFTSVSLGDEATQPLVDVEVDSQARVWLLASDRLLVFQPAHAIAAP